MKLEEARKLATPGSWTADPEGEVAISIEGGDGSVVCDVHGGVGDRRSSANAALIAHEHNTHQELVETLIKASQDLVAGHVVDSILHKKKHPRSPPLPEPTSLAAIRRVLARVDEVPGI